MVIALGAIDSGKLLSPILSSPVLICSFEYMNIPFLFFEIRFHCIDKAGLEFRDPPPLPPEY